METITVDMRDILKAATALRSQAQGKLLAGFRPTLYQLLIAARGDMQELVSGPVLNVRTGTLRRSLTAEAPVLQGTDRLVGRVGLLKAGPAQKYGHFLVKGGTIVARGKYLAIPVGPARTAAGVARYRSPRDIPDLFFIKSKRGTALLVKSVTRGRGKRRTRTIVPYFVLKRSVRIGPHDYVSWPQRILLQKATERLKEYAAGAITLKS